MTSECTVTFQYCCSVSKRKTWSSFLSRLAEWAQNSNFITTTGSWIDRTSIGLYHWFFYPQTRHNNLFSTSLIYGRPLICLVHTFLLTMTWSIDFYLSCFFKDKGSMIQGLLLYVCMLHHSSQFLTYNFPGFYQFWKIFSLQY